MIHAFTKYITEYMNVDSLLNGLDKVSCFTIQYKSNKLQTT